MGVSSAGQVESSKRFATGPPASTAPLLQHFFELLTDYCPIEAIDDDMEPAALVAIHGEVRRSGGNLVGADAAKAA